MTVCVGDNKKEAEGAWVWAGGIRSIKTSVLPLQATRPNKRIDKVFGFLLIASKALKRRFEVESCRVVCSAMHRGKWKWESGVRGGYGTK